jgi:hypothetical protein
MRLRFFRERLVGKLRKCVRELETVISVQDSTIDYYHEYRWELLSDICGFNIPMCEQCGRLLHVDIDSLHVHHVNHEEGHGDQQGGWQHLYKLRDDFENGVELEVLCHGCHDHRHTQSLWKMEVLQLEV